MVQVYCDHPARTYPAARIIGAHPVSKWAMGEWRSVATRRSSARWILAIAFGWNYRGLPRRQKGFNHAFIGIEGLISQQGIGFHLVRSPPASDPSLRNARSSALHGRAKNYFQRNTTKVSEHKAFVAAWSSPVYLCQLPRNGCPAELLAFPYGRHDDCVDALGLTGQLLDKWSADMRPPHRATEFQDKSYRTYSLDEARPPSFMTL